MYNRICLSLVFLLIVAASALAQSEGGCVASAPLEVLDCYAQAYNENDLEILQALLAHDYRYDLGAEGQVQPYGREEELEAAARMFESEMALSRTVSFNSDIEVQPGEESGVWLLHNVEGTHHTTYLTDSGETKDSTVSEGNFVLTVRSTGGENPRFQLVRWEKEFDSED